MTTEPPIITRADIQAEWIAANPKPCPRTSSSDVILAWARRWRQSDAFRRCCELTEQMTESVTQPTTTQP